MLTEIQKDLVPLCATIKRHETMLNTDSTLSLPSKVANHESRLTALETKGAGFGVSFDRILLVLIAVASPFITMVLTPKSTNQDPNAYVNRHSFANTYSQPCSRLAENYYTC